MENLKAPLAFQIFSGIAILTAFCYYLIGKLFIVPRQNKRLLQKLEVMKMPVETISRREHRRSSRTPELTNMSDGSTLQRYKKKKSAPQVKDIQEKLEKTKPLDETQMTDLPDDSMLSLNETVLEEEPSVPNEPNNEPNESNENNEPDKPKEKDEKDEKNEKTKESAC